VSPRFMIFLVLMCLPMPPGSVQAQAPIELSQARSTALPTKNARPNLETICGLIDSSEDVEFYGGKLGPSRDFVDRQQTSTAQIQWRDDLQTTFSAPGENPGNVGGRRWCSGTLVSDRLLLTAGHCFEIDPRNGGWTTPRRLRNGKIEPVPPEDMAPLMVANFNYQKDGSDPEHKRLRSSDVFPITRMVENGLSPQRGNLDYVIVELSANSQGRLPGEDYLVSTWDASIAGLQSSRLLTVIQHPNGDPKRIEAGVRLFANSSALEYADIDTLGGSSGSGVINELGKIVGVHVRGGCSASGGRNKAVPLVAIARHSDVIK
jgi:V8-like Glu-specific endopeptidase